MKRNFLFALVILLLLLPSPSQQQTRVIGVCGPPGTGRLRSITGTNPAAGVEISETVPADTRWRLMSMRAILVTDATVAIRVVRLQPDDGTTILFALAADNSQTAGQTIGYSMAVFGTATVPTGADRNINLPAEVIFPAGARIQTIVSNFQAGDNWEAPQLLVEECTP